LGQLMWSRLWMAQLSPLKPRLINQMMVIQVAQLPQRDYAAGWVSYVQKWKTGTRRQYFTDIIGLPSTKQSNSVKNAK